MRYSINLARVEPGVTPQIAHINTAGGDQQAIEGVQIEAARQIGVHASHLRLFPRENVENLEHYLLSQDVIWVSGGSVVNLLAVWRAHGLDTLLARAWRSGVVLAGVSAGALCWHESGTTSAFGPAISAFHGGLGLIPGSFAVHYNSNPKRPRVHESAIANRELDAGLAVDEGVGVVYHDTEAVAFVAETAVGRAYHLSRDGTGRVVRREVIPKVLHEADVYPRANTTQSNSRAGRRHEE